MDDTDSSVGDRGWLGKANDVVSTHDDVPVAGGVICFFFFFKGSGAHGDLPSSPPRRSSDLGPRKSPASPPFHFSPTRVHRANMPDCSSSVNITSPTVKPIARSA